MKCVQITSKEKPSGWKIDLKVKAVHKNNWTPAGMVFDTGSEVSSITEELRAFLGARIVDKQYMKGTNGGDWHTVCYLDIELYDGCIITNQRFTVTPHDMGCHVLLGMDIIADGDFHTFKDKDGLYKCTFCYG